VVILLCAGTVFGQVGFIGLFPDAGTYYQCDYVDAVPGLVPIYAVHKYTPGATASQWMVVLGGGFNCIHVGEIVHMPVSIGSALSGVSLGYGTCIAADILLVTINFFCQGISPTCAYLQVVGDIASASGEVEVVDCTFTLHIGVGGTLYFNADDTCYCLITTKETSWGKVKALYQ
jgi:hypothetical protein